MSDPKTRQEQSRALPALQQAILDTSTVETLFTDLETCTRVLSVLPKTGSLSHAPDRSISLAEARTGLLDGTFRGVQIRYLYEGETWCDTLIATPAGPRLVRIRDAEIGSAGG